MDGRVLGYGELYQQFDAKDFYPNLLVLKYLKDVTSTADADEPYVGLDWSGVEQLTDKFFLLAQDDPFKLCLEHVTQVSLRSCRYLTNLTLDCLGSITPNVEKVFLDGCVNITEVGLLSLVKKCPNLKHVGLIGTAVSLIPAIFNEEPASRIQLILDGCPLINPPPAVESQGCSPCSKHKVIIHAVDEGLSSLARLLTSGEMVDYDEYQPEKITFIEDASIPGIDEKLTIFECHGGKLTAVPFVSERAVHVIVVDIDTTGNPQVDIMSMVNSIRGEVGNVPFMIVLVHQSPNIGQSLLAASLGPDIRDYFKKQYQSLKGHVTSLSAASLLESSTELDFTEQLHAARSAGAKQDLEPFYILRVVRSTKQVELHWPEKKVKVDRGEMASKAASLKSELQAQLDEFGPVWESAMKELQSLSKSDLAEIKSMKSPPQALIHTFTAVAVILGVKTSKGQTRNGGPSAEIVKVLLADFRIISKLTDFNFVDTELSKKQMLELKKYIDMPQMTCDHLRKVSRCAASFWKWAEAVYTYNSVYAAKFKVLRVELKTVEALLGSAESSDGMIEVEPENMDPTLKRDIGVVEQDLIHRHLAWIVNYQIAFDLTERDISTITAMENPPEVACKVLKAVAILFGKEPSLEAASELMSATSASGSNQFIVSVKKYDKHNIPQSVIDRLKAEQKKGTIDLDMNFEEVERQCPQIFRLYVWVVAMYKYATEVLPNARSLDDRWKNLKGASASADRDDGLDELRNILKSLLEHEKARDPLQHHKIAFSGEFHQIRKAVKEFKEEKIVLLDKLLSSPDLATEESFPAWFNRKSIQRVLHHMQIMGEVLYFPNVPGFPMVTDMEWFVKVTNHFLAYRKENPTVDMKITAMKPNAEIYDSHIALHGLALDSQIVLLESIWKDQSMLLSFPMGRPAKSTGEYVHCPVPRLGMKFHVRTNATHGKYSDYYFANQHWPDWGLASILDVTSHVGVTYDLTVGMPVKLWYMLYNEFLNMGMVLLVSHYGILLRQGALDVYIRNSVHAVHVSESIKIEARLNVDKERAPVEQRRQYIWGVLSDILLIIDYHLNQYSKLHYSVRFTCPGDCAKKGQGHKFTLREITKTTPATPLICPSCAELKRPTDEMRLLLGRQYTFMHHDFVELIRDHQSTKNQHVMYPWTYELGHMTQDIFVCNHCGIRKEDATRLWHMHTTLYPSFAANCMENMTGTGNMLGNIIQAPSATQLKEEDLQVTEESGPVFVMTETLKDCLAGGKIEILILKAGAIQLLLDQHKYLSPGTGEPGVEVGVEDRLDLSLGKHYHTDRNEAVVSETDAAGLICKPGDTLTIDVMPKSADATTWENRDLETLCLMKNGRKILEMECNKNVHLGLHVMTSEGEHPSLVFHCPAAPAILAHHFPLGSALLYRMEAGNQWALGQVLAITGNKLIVGHSSESSASVVTVSASSEHLLPVDSFMQNLTIFCGSDIIKRKEQITAYLVQQNAFAAPHGLFQHANIKGIQSMSAKFKSERSSLMGLDEHEPHLCLVSRNSPQVIRARYQKKVPTMHLKRWQVGRVFLPAVLDTKILLFPMPAMMHSWNQTLHTLCRSTNTADLQLVESHFVNAPGRQLSSAALDALCTKYLDEVVFEYYLLSFCQTILTGWSSMGSEIMKNSSQEVESGLTIEEASELAHRVIDMYFSNLLCMWALTPASISEKKKQELEETSLEEIFSEDASSHLLFSKSCCRCPLHHNLAENKQPSGDFSGDTLSRTVSVLRLTNFENDVLAMLPYIQVLDISMQFLESVDDVVQLPMLRRLKASGNRIRELPGDFERLAGTLEILELGGNELRSLPDSLCMFQHLQKLDVSGNLLTSLPQDFGELSQLHCLNANHNHISCLPKSFAKLKNLRVLLLDGVEWPIGWSKWPSPPVSLNSIRIIPYSAWWGYTNSTMGYKSLSQEEVVEIFAQCDFSRDGSLAGDEIIALCKLLYDYFPRFRPTSEDPNGFPVQILGCHKLEELSLGFQGFKTVPYDIRRLPCLKSVSLSYSPILEVISGELGRSNLQTLNIAACPKLKTPPAEIVSQGGQSVIAYLKRLSQGASECYRTKLMFVGLGGAGKTSLMRALMSGTYKAPVIQGEGITDGIDINNWSIKRGNSPTITYSVWDFAGQTVYYNTHQFFLSKRAVYLLIWNTRLGYEHSGLDFWLSSIACHCPKAPIFIIGTHADQITKSELPKESMSERFLNIVGFHTISSVDGTGVEALLDSLIKVTLEQPYIGERIPEAWLNFEQMILQERKEQSILEWQQICDSATQACIYDTEVQQAVRFLHDLGTLQYFDNDFLRDRVVVNPQWIVDVMACLVSVKNQVIQDGRLKHSDIPVIWQDYPEELHDWLLRLTQVFDLTFPLEDKEESIVPCLLPQTMPEFTWPVKDNDEVEIKLVYKFEYLPAGLFNRAQVRLYQYCSESLMWKSGAVLKKNGHIALVKQLQNAEVLVKVQGPCPQNILLLIHEVYETLIADFFQGVKYEYLLPCTECMKMDTGDPTMFSSRTLRRAIEMKSLFLQCHQFFHILSMTDIQGHLLPQSGNDFDIQLQNTVRELGAIEEDLGMDVFFLYCSKNLPKPEESAIHPLQIKEDLETHGFRCVFVENIEEKSVDDLATTIKTCKVVVLMISTELAEDAHCQRLCNFAYSSLHKPCVLAMVGTDRNWQKTQLGMQLVHKVFINFQKVPQYEIKIAELVKQLKELIQRQDTGLAKPDVFLSYCWSNSARAIEEGRAMKKPGAVGHGDPLEIKSFLESHGLVTWLDVERAGKTGLFEDIAEGMKQCKVIVACVSDEYVLSQNCQMEFRFAHIALRKPVILAVVGTGFLWESTEVGMLSLGYTKINFQLANEIAHNQLLESVKDALAKCPDAVKTVSTKEIQFQELYELAQRKFLRQISIFSEGQEPFPRLFVADLTAGLQNGPSQPFNFANLQPGDFCIKFLCEYEKGWHVTSTSLPVELSGQDLATLWQLTAPYMARLLVVLKHSNTNLHILNTGVGTKLIQDLEKTLCQSETQELQKVYMSVRQYLMVKDSSHTYGGLKRCHMPNGKVMWLCDKHQMHSRIAVLKDKPPQENPQTGDRFEYELLSQLRKVQEDSVKKAVEQDMPKTVTDIPKPSKEAAAVSSRPASSSSKQSANMSDTMDERSEVSVPSRKQSQAKNRKVNLLRGKNGPQRKDGSPGTQMQIAAHSVAGNIQNTSNACNIL